MSIFNNNDFKSDVEQICGECTDNFRKSKTKEDVRKSFSKYDKEITCTINQEANNIVILAGLGALGIIGIFGLVVKQISNRSYDLGTAAFCRRLMKDRDRKFDYKD